MVNLQPQSTTERGANILLEEEDERERVLLVGVGVGEKSKGTGTFDRSNVPVPFDTALSRGSLSLDGSAQHAGSGDNDPLAVVAQPPLLTIATYALDVTHVREVIRNRQTTRVPGSPGVLRGLVNVRGMVVTVLDLATCLGHQSPSPAANAGTVTEVRAQMPGSIVLLEHGSRLVGLAVDSVREVRSLDDGGLVGQSASDELRQGFVRGLASAGGEVVTVLDVAALISRHLISGES